MERIGVILKHGPDSKIQATPKIMPTWRPEPFKCSPDNQTGESIPAEWDRVDAKLQRAIKTAYESDLWPWYIHGVAGTGKTSAAACVFRTFASEFNYFWDCGRACRDLVCARANYEEWQMRRKIQNAGLIVLDDVATREPTGAQLDALLSIINWRSGKPLIVTGNASPAALAEFIRDDRVVSRLCAGVTIEVTGTDKRLRAAQALKA